MAYTYVNPTVTVPVGALELINKVMNLFGESVTVFLCSPYEDDDDAEWVNVQWENDVPRHLRDCLWAAADEVNVLIAPDTVFRVRGGDGKPLELFIRTA